VRHAPPCSICAAPEDCLPTLASAFAVHFRKVSCARAAHFEVGPRFAWRQPSFAPLAASTVDGQSWLPPRSLFLARLGANSPQLWWCIFLTVRSRASLFAKVPRQSSVLTPRLCLCIYGWRQLTVATCFNRLTPFVRRSLAVFGALAGASPCAPRQLTPLQFWRDSRNFQRLDSNCIGPLDFCSTGLANHVAHI